MLQKRFWLLFGMTLAIGTAVIVGGYLSIDESMAARTPQAACYVPATGVPTCYTQPELLSRQAPTALATSPIGQTVVTGVKHQIALWDLQTGRQTRSLRGHSDRITALAVSLDGTTLASSSLDGTTKLWNLTTGTLLGTISSGRATSLSFSPDGKTLVSGSRVDRWADGPVSPMGAQLWDVGTLQPRGTVGNRPVSAIAFSPDGQQVATGGSNTRLWDVATGKPGYIMDSGEVTRLVFTQDGQTLMSGSSRIKFWQVATGELAYRINSGALDMSLSPDGETLAVSNGGTVTLWRLQTKQVITSLRTSWFSGLFVSYGLNGEAIVTGSSDGLQLWRSRLRATLPAGSLTTQR